MEQLHKNSMRTIHILLIEKDVNDSDHTLTALKALGKQLGVNIQATQQTQLKKIRKCLLLQEADIILQAVEAGSITLEDTLGLLRKQKLNIPIIALTRSKHRDPAPFIRAGIEDLVQKGATRHLQVIVRRLIRQIELEYQLEQNVIKLKQAERRTRKLLTSSRDAISYIQDGLHIYANPAYLELFGYEDMEELLAIPVIDLVTQQDQARFRDILHDQEKKQNAVSNINLTLLNIDGVAFMGLAQLSPAQFENSSCTQLLVDNQGNAQELQRKLQFVRSHDTVTGLHNRPFLFQQLNRAIQIAQGQKRRFGLIVIKLNDFSRLRRVAGYTGSDHILASVAQRIKQFARHKEVIGRYESNAFVLITPYADKKTLGQLVEVLQKAITTEAQKHILRPELRCTTTAGITLITEKTHDANELFVEIDALIHAQAQASKQEGDACKEGNCYQFYQATDGEPSLAEKDAEMTARIREALVSNQFMVFFQPVLSLNEDGIERYAVYMRMMGNDNDQDVITAKDFLPSAERTGIAKVLDRWVISQALKRLAEQLKHKPNTLFFIKLTAGSLQDKAILRWLLESLSRLKIPPTQVAFSLKESTIADNIKAAKTFAQGLHQIRCSIVLDDFGSGINSFQLLKHIPADYLKVHPDLVKDIADKPENQKALKNIVEQAEISSRYVIVPRVENISVLSTLYGLNVSFVQGYFLQAPRADLDFEFGMTLG